jgi:DNA-binding SARP family transcriptional activator
LVSLAEIERGEKRYREAKELYEKIIAADPYRDEAHLALMKCLVASGATSAAISHFKLYKKLLHRDLNSEPLPALESYYAEISAKPKEVI